jgi:hypothetical protein
VTIPIDPSALDLHLWLGIPFSILVFALVIFCFRQGFKVKPDSSGSPPGDAVGLLFPPR